eukprot:8092457-Ditylum_brightwellii.AAC.1
MSKLIISPNQPTGSQYHTLKPKYSQHKHGQYTVTILSHNTFALLQSQLKKQQDCIFNNCSIVKIKGMSNVLLSAATNHHLVGSQCQLASGARTRSIVIIPGATNPDAEPLIPASHNSG